MVDHPLSLSEVLTENIYKAQLPAPGLPPPLLAVGSVLVVG